MLKAGERLRSVTLRADAHHLLTDVWTTVGVVVGLFLVKLTGWLVLDPIIALIVAVNIVWAGVRLLRETGSGLLDASLPAAEQKIITDTFLAYQDERYPVSCSANAGSWNTTICILPCTCAGTVDDSAWS
jgi:cation diffusion facilitator family transporter